jgi:DNA polymerase/3'-5' exonuclease PolX
MSKQIDVQEMYRRKEEMRKRRAKMPIVEKLAVAEELRDLQKALAPIREANRANLRRKRDRVSD